MRGRSLIRLVMVALFAGVVAAVALLWRSPPADIAVDAPEPPDIEAGVVSRSEGLTYSAYDNGIPHYQLKALRGLEMEGNRSRYEGDVELVLYSLPEAEGGPQEVTVVRADRLELMRRVVPIEGDEFESVRLFDDVRATLPNGAEFVSDMLVYADGELTTDLGVRLRAGGMVIESAHMTYVRDTGIATLHSFHEQTERPQMRGPVKLWSEGGREAGTLDLQGDAHSLEYDLDAALLQLNGVPQVHLPEALVRGDAITLTLDDQATAIEAIEARGRAHASLQQTDGIGSELSAEIIAVALGDGGPSRLTAFNEAADPARPGVVVADGELRADLIEVAFGEDDRPPVTARGEAFFIPASTAELEHIGADRLLMNSGADEQLLGIGNVEIRLVGEQGPVLLQGPRACFVIREAAIAGAEWPAGMSYRDEAQDVDASAAHGALDAESGEWLLRARAPSGDAARSASVAGCSDATAGATEATVGGRPRLTAPEIDVDADVLRLSPQGDVALRGAVGARLRGDAVRTVGALFGDAPEVQASSEELLVHGASGRLEFSGGARVSQQDSEQLLQADRIALRPEVDELQADGNVFVSLLEAADPEREGEQPGVVLLTGRSLLVEGSPPLLVMAGEAHLELAGQQRTIRGNRLSVQLTDDGAWHALEVVDNVTMTDAAGTGEGARLEYDADSGVVVIHAGPGAQASFVNDQDVDIRDLLGLRLVWVDDRVEVHAMQNGTTQVVRRNQRTQR